jgi:hypothetical protein
MMFWWLNPQYTSLFLKTKYMNQWRGAKTFILFAYRSGIFWNCEFLLYHRTHSMLFSINFAEIFKHVDMKYRWDFNFCKKLSTICSGTNNHQWIDILLQIWILKKSELCA